jgi:hypothetical protein
MAVVNPPPIRRRITNDLPPIKSSPAPVGGARALPNIKSRNWPAVNKRERLTRYNSARMEAAKRRLASFNKGKK